MSRSCRGVRSISHFQRPLPLCCLPISPARSRHLSSFFRRLETGWRSSFESFGGDATGPTTTTSPPSSTTTSSCSPHSSSAYNLFPGSSAFIPYSSSLSSSSLLPIAPAPLPALLLDRKCPSSSSSGPQPLSIFDLFDKSKVGINKRSFFFHHAAFGLAKSWPSYPFPPTKAQHLPQHLSTPLMSSSSSSSSSPNNASQTLLSTSCGEDSYFQSSNCLAVADGVGGWVSVKGANPALYSSLIMHYVGSEAIQMEKVNVADPSLDDINGAGTNVILDHNYITATAASAVEEAEQTSLVEGGGDRGIDNNEVITTSTMLSKSYNIVKRYEDSYNLVGSTTALVAVLQNEDLQISNIGDCGLMILRNLEPIFRTEEQQHSFNFPYQLGTGSRDSPESAQFINVRVKEGDVVIVASDGVWDNLFDEDVVNIVRECCLATSTVSPNNSSSSSSAFSSSTNNSLSNTGGHFSDYLSKKTSSYGSSLTGSTANTPSTMRLYIDPKKIANAIILKARTIAEDSKCTSSPFQSRAIQEGLYYQGGKLDDMTVLVGLIKAVEDSPDRR